MTTLAPGALWRPLRKAHTARRVHPELGLVMHAQQGNNSPFGWFNRAGSNSSSTWWISKAGLIEQYVDPDTCYAWAQGTGNTQYHSVEFEGWVGEPLTERALAAAAQLYAWGADERGWALRTAERPGQAGFGWHGMGAAAGWGHPDCPGPIRRAQRAEILTRAADILDHTRQTKATPITEDDVMTPEQERKLDTAIDIGRQILRQLGGDYDAGTWPGWKQLGGRTLVDAVADLPKDSADALLAREVLVRDPKTGLGAKVQVETTLTRASEAAEARQHLGNVLPVAASKPAS